MQYVLSFHFSPISIRGATQFEAWTGKLRIGDQKQWTADKQLYVAETVLATDECGISTLNNSNWLNEWL